jgi:hypothetical protein
VLLIKEKCTLKIISPQTAVQDGKFGSPVVRSSRLEQNYPNPFNNETSLTFSLSHAGQTTLTVVDLQGREVITLVDGHLASGSYRIGWNGADRFHKAAASGSYFSLLFIDGVLFDYRKITLLR